MPNADDADGILGRLLDGTASDADASALETWLAQHPERPAMVARTLCLHRILQAMGTAHPPVADIVMAALPVVPGHCMAVPVMADIDARNDPDHPHPRIASQPRPRHGRRMFLAAALFAIGVSLVMYMAGTAPSGRTSPVVSRADGAVTVVAGQRLTAPATLHTGKDARLDLAYPDGTTVAIDGGSQVRLVAGTGVTIAVHAGGLTAQVAPQPAGDPMRVSTPHAVATIVGTRFQLSADADGTRLAVDHGTVRFCRLLDQRTVAVTAGQTIASRDMEVRPLDAGTFVTGINFGGPPVTVDGHRWLGQDEAERSGLVLSSFAKINPLAGGDGIRSPATADQGLRQVLATGLWAWHADLAISYPLVPGDYRVSLLIAEPERNGQRRFDVRLQGSIVATDAGGTLMAGTWQKLGPFPATVSDGRLVLNLERQQGCPLILGMAIARAGR